MSSKSTLIPSPDGRLWRSIAGVALEAAAPASTHSSTHLDVHSRRALSACILASDASSSRPFEAFRTLTTARTACACDKNAEGPGPQQATVSTVQDRAGQGRAGQDMIGQGRTGQDKAGQYIAGRCNTVGCAVQTVIRVILPKLCAMPPCNAGAMFSGCIEPQNKLRDVSRRLVFNKNECTHAALNLLLHAAPRWSNVRAETIRARKNGGSSPARCI